MIRRVFLSGRSAIAALAMAAGLALAAPAAGQVANTWSGTWVNSAPDGTFWVFSQSGSGQSVGGVWKGNASSGTLSGTIQGSTLTGTLVNNEVGQSASYSITLAPDGHSFSGTFTIVGGSTGQWRSACSGGACLSNAAPPPPPPPPVGPPGGGAPAPPLSPKVLAAATAWGQVGPATALGPGESAIATSPRISPSQRGISVTLSGDVSGETAPVFGVPTSTKKGRPITGGDCVRGALGAAQLAKEIIEGNGYIEQLPVAADDVVLDFYFVEFMITCLDYVKQLEKQAQSAALPPAAGAARTSCRLRARPLSVRHDRVARTISWSTRRASRHEPVRRLRSSCRKGRNGTVTLRIRTASRRIKLRKVLGPRLVVGAYRSADASGPAKVQTTFKRR